MEIVTEGIKSKERVEQYGEVFTPMNIVKDMVDLIPVYEDKSKELSKTWLEPACGTGNFLVEILERKLKLIDTEDEDNVGIQLFTAVSTIYGVDIQPDNVKESRKRLTELLDNWYIKEFGESTEDNLLKALKFVIDKNIIWGNTLTGREKLGEDENKELILVEWNIDGCTVHRKDYTFNSLLEVEGGCELNDYKTVNYLKINKARKIVTKEEDLFS